MTALVFVDTNVLIYAMDLADPIKQKVAHSWRSQLWLSVTGRVSFQVLQEFYANVIQKKIAARDDAREEVRDLMAWHPVAIDAELVERAWKLQDRFQFSFWDALIVAAAKAAACKFLLSEDFQHHQDLEGLIVVNPFLQATLA